MKYTLTLHEEGRTGVGPVLGSGAAFRYRVGGMPEGEEANIANFGAPNRNDWQVMRIKHNEQSGWTGNYQSAEAALAELQKEFE